MAILPEGGAKETIIDSNHLKDKVEEDRYSIFILTCNSCVSVV